MSATKDWYMSLQDETEVAESYRLRLLEEEYEYWLESKREEEIEILNQLLIEDSYEASSITTSTDKGDAPFLVQHNIQQC